MGRYKRTRRSRRHSSRCRLTNTITAWQRISGIINWIAMKAGVMRAMLSTAVVITGCFVASFSSAQEPLGPMMVLPSHPGGSEPPSAPWAPPESASAAQPPAIPAAAPYPATASGDATPIDDLPSPPPQAEPTQIAAPGVALPDGRLFGDDVPWNRSVRWFSPVPWDAGVELGVNGSTGTSDTLSMRAGTTMKRESRFSKLDFSTYYNRTVSEGLVTQNNATLNIKNDWLLDDSVPWTLFAKADAFYDKFQAYDEQTNVDTGVGYRFWHEPALNLTGRLGAGGSREFGGPNNEWTPEGLAGVDYDQKITAAHKVSFKVEYFPDLEQLVNYRIVSEASWEVALAQPSNLSLKLSATDRYDSTPDGAKPTLMNYSILMLLKL
jgi:putative salt-induced outer membrane protein YdiY